jgi:hypothetical protein
LEKPSKETELSAMSRNSAPLKVRGATAASFAPGQTRRSRGVRWTMPKREIMPKNTDRNSPRLDHVSKPNSSIAAKLKHQ